MELGSVYQGTMDAVPDLVLLGYTEEIINGPENATIHDVPGWDKGNLGQDRIHQQGDELLSQLDGQSIGGIEQTGDAIRDLICSYDWDCGEALGVVYGNARCQNGESTGNPGAYAEGNYGLFQINAVHSARVGGILESLFDPATNVRVAHDIWSDQGWAPWGCRP